jgi:5-methylcytosine-specific restriction endonuclease McrA
MPNRDSPGRWTGPGAGSFRELTLAKTGGRCERCGSDDRVEAHHVIALSEGGSNDAATNGQALCFECHKEIERGRLRANGGR